MSDPSEIEGMPLPGVDTDTPWGPLRNKNDEVCMEIKDENKFDVLRSMIYQAVGHASMCWEFPEKAGVFDTEQASCVGDALYDSISKIYGIENLDSDE